MSAFFTVTKKELQDLFSNWRILILLLIVAAGVIYLFMAARDIRSVVTFDTQFIFIAIFSGQAFTATTDFIPNTFIALMATLIPIAGIILGLDAINSERANGTLGRLVSQPIYRDNIFNAKFTAGVITIMLMVLTIVLLGGAMSLRIIGVAPGAEEILRIFIFCLLAIIYGAFWLGLSMLFSTLFKQVAVSAILSIAVWLFFYFFYPLIINAVVNQMAQTIENAYTVVLLSRFSPIRLFEESIAVILIPLMRSASQWLTLLISDAQYFFVLNPISLTQSLISVWPQAVITILMTVVCFAVAYIKFMFEEIRSI